MNKEVKKIFLVLFFYALSGGVVYNFQELWMADNNLSTKTISIVISLCALLTVSAIFLCSNLIDRKKIKKFTSLLTLLKALALFLLYILNGTGLNFFIKLLIMIDYVIEVEIYACIYPMISYIAKDDKLYAKRDIIYRFAYSVGMLVTSILLGKTIMSLDINFNTYCLIASILMLISYFILIKTDLNKYIKGTKDKNDSKIFYQVLSKIKKDKITKNYLAFTLFDNASYRCVTGLLVLLLTTNLGFSATLAGNFKIVLGIIGPVLALFILEKLTFKNNYVNISIKFIVRAILYLLAFLTNHKIFFLLSIVHARLFTETYLHVTDAPYVNRFSPEEQLSFCNLKEMIKYLAVSIGTFICGIMLNLGTKYIFLVALILLIVQIVFAFRALKFYNEEKKEHEV